MSFSKIFSNAAVAVGIAAMSAVSLAGAAQAYDGRGHGYRGDHRAFERHRSGPDRRHYRDHHHRGDHDRDRGRNKHIGRGVAIGVGAVLLGTILAAEAAKRNNRDYHD